jgi:hypothetical protein
MRVPLATKLDRMASKGSFLDRRGHSPREWLLFVRRDGAAGDGPTECIGSGPDPSRCR